jgi:hypothetical protein|tara:strand:- start:1922 stop:2338 length:417 start_codon:yes stop_codon:yes gene_type:complete
MATTTATITLSSTDLLSDELALTTTATLTGAGNSTGLTGALGLSRKTTSAVTQYTLLSASNRTADKAHKVYLKNTATNAGYYFLVKLGDREVGRLYAGDWAFFPWSADEGGTDGNINILPQGSSTNEVTLEYMVLTDD